VQQMRELVELEEEMLKTPGRLPADELLIKAKKDGFSDKYIAKILGIREKDVRKKRTELGVVEGWCAVPVSGVKDQYYYSTYNCKDESTASTNPKKIMILGGGPNRLQRLQSFFCIFFPLSIEDCDKNVTVVKDVHSRPFFWIILRFRVYIYGKPRSKRG